MPRSWEEILGQIEVVNEIRDALLFRKGVYGDLLKLRKYIERIGVGLSIDELHDL